jgi:hypothetical protein
MLTFEETKLLINQKVKFAIPEGSSSELESGKVISGTLIKILYNGEYDGKDIITSFSCNVDLTGVNGVYHLNVKEIYDMEIIETDIKQINLQKLIDIKTIELNKLNADLAKEKV